MFKFINKVRSKEYSKEKGFSLLELSVAVGIAAIVGAAGIVATTGFIGSAETKKDNYVANAERAIAEAESSSLALGETGSTGNSGEENEPEETLTVPGAPTTVLASNIISTGATLTWTAPETGEVGEYIVTLNGDVQGSEPIPNDVFSYDFTNLTVNTDYEAKVFAKSNDGTLSNAGEEKFYTAFRPMVATGGDKVHDIVQDGIVYRVHEFTTVGESSFVVTNAGETGEVEYLVVAGGGGGGAGGGGAGGLLSGNEIIITTSFPISVGVGGTKGSTGSNSVAFSQTAIGGGFGGHNSGINATTNSDGGDGGSGGGGATNAAGNAKGTAGNGGDGPPRQGFDGGTGANNSGYGKGGGGGSAAVGSSVPDGTGTGGDGGAGTSSTITGSSVEYAGGGGGGAGNISGEVGGSGQAGGGDGGSGVNGTGTNALANTGSGGGGATNGGSADAGTGGSGIIIVRYPVGIVN